MQAIARSFIARSLQNSSRYYFSPSMRLPSSIVKTGTIARTLWKERYRVIQIKKNDPAYQADCRKALRLAG
jgi:hypothetical protein